jgi:hypothetical protein
VTPGVAAKTSRLNSVEVRWTFPPADRGTASPLAPRSITAGRGRRPSRGGGGAQPREQPGRRAASGRQSAQVERADDVVSSSTTGHLTVAPFAQPLEHVSPGMSGRRSGVSGAATPPTGPRRPSPPRTPSPVRLGARVRILVWSQDAARSLMSPLHFRGGELARRRPGSPPRRAALRLDEPAGEAEPVRGAASRAAGTTDSRA